ncbi:TPA: hypothetical protein DIS61_04385 [Patescibacteria group bacterium]|nr:hypothetical protein [Patescibacteria group bacterium]
MHGWNPDEPNTQYLILPQKVIRIPAVENSPELILVASEPPRTKVRGFSFDTGGETPYRKPKMPFIPRLKSGAFWYWGNVPYPLLAVVLFILQFPLFSPSL